MTTLSSKPLVVSGVAKELALRFQQVAQGQCAAIADNRAWSHRAGLSDNAEYVNPREMLAYYALSAIAQGNLGAVTRQNIEALLGFSATNHDMFGHFATTYRSLLELVKEGVRSGVVVQSALNSQHANVL